MKRTTSQNTMPHHTIEACEAYISETNTTIRTGYHFTINNETSFHCEGVLIQMAQRDPVINETYVKSRRCDRLAQMALSDDLSTFVRPFRTTQYTRPSDDDSGTGWRGGGRKRKGTGDVKTAGRTAGPRGAGERGASTKILSR